MELYDIPIVIEQNAVVNSAAGIPKVDVNGAVHIDVGIQDKIIAAGSYASFADLLVTPRRSNSV